MNYDRERLLLQICVIVAALVPLSAGLAGSIYGGALTGDTLSSSGESHWRYLSGLLFAIGLAFWSTVPSIESKTDRFRLLTLIVFTGGTFRALSLLVDTWPSQFMLGGAVMEVVVTPLLCAWQSRIATLAGA